MTMYQVALALHVITSILGVGQVVGIAVLASAASAHGPAGSAHWVALQRLTRGTTGSLVMMLLTGGWIEMASGGGYHETWWFRISFALLLVLGAIAAGIRRSLRRREAAGERHALQQIVRRAWAMCAITACVAALMAVKPW